MRLNNDERAPGATSSNAPLWRLWAICLFAVFAAGYLWFVRAHCSYTAAGADSSGYMNLARGLKDGVWLRTVEPIPAVEASQWNPLFQLPLGYVFNEAKGVFVPSYPVGLPLHLVAASSLVGLEYAPLLVNALLVAAMGVLLFLLARQLGLPIEWSLGAVVLLSLCPLYLCYAIQTMSDVAATVWTTAAIYFGLRTKDNTGWGYLAGFATGISILVRPTDLLVLIPLGVALKRTWSSLFAVILGGLPAAVFLVYFNLMTYDAVFTTGYGGIGALLQAKFAPHNLWHFSLWITVLLTPFIVFPALGIFAFAQLRRQAIVLAAWVAAITGFYVFYYHSGETWWYTRFILPAFPAILLAGMLVLHELWKMQNRSGWRQWGPCAGLLFLASIEIITIVLLNFTQSKHSEITYAKAAAWMKANVPSNAIVLQMQTSGAFTFYTNFTLVRWDLITPQGWGAVRSAAQESHRPVYAGLFDFENADALRKKAPGNWTKIEQFRGFYVWRLDEVPQEK